MKLKKGNNLKFKIGQEKGVYISSGQEKESDCISLLNVGIMVDGSVETYKKDIPKVNHHLINFLEEDVDSSYYIAEDIANQLLD